MILDKTKGLLTKGESLTRKHFMYWCREISVSLMM